MASSQITQIPIELIEEVEAASIETVPTDDPGDDEQCGHESIVFCFDKLECKIGNRKFNIKDGKYFEVV